MRIGPQVLLGIGLLACSGDDGPAKDTDVEADADTDADADADADTDTDTDADTDTDTDTETGTIAAVGPMISGWYELNSYVYWQFQAASTFGGRDSGRPPPRDTIDTARPPGDYLQVANLFIYGQFGFDAVGGTLEAVDIDGTPITPTIELYLATASWQNDLSDVANYCYIVLPLDNAPGPAPFVSTVGRLWWGVDYDEALNAPESNCHQPGWELDPFMWGTDIVADFVSYYGAGTWGIAAGEPSPIIQSDVIPQFGPDGIYVIGGQMRVPNFIGGAVDELYGFVWEVDASMVVQVDGSGYLIPIENNDAFPYP